MAALGCWPWQSDRKKRHRNVIRLPGNAGSSLTATPPLQVSDSRHSTKARPKLSSNLRPLFTSTAYAVLLLFCFFFGLPFRPQFPAVDRRNNPAAADLVRVSSDSKSRKRGAPIADWLPVGQSEVTLRCSRRRAPGFSRPHWSLDETASLPLSQPVVFFPNFYRQCSPILIEIDR